MHTPNTNLHAFTQTVQTLLTNPSYLLPHLTISTLTSLPERDLGSHFLHATSQSQSTPPTIRALVLDKDNTLCRPKTTHFPKAILSKLHSLRQKTFSHPSSLLIVSNRAGSSPAYEHEIPCLEKELAASGLEIPVFRVPEGCEKKPFCGDEVVAWFRERGVVKGPDEIAVVGDRIGTDGLMARRMGAWSVWCRDGVWGEEADEKRNVLEKMEVWVERYLRENRGLMPPPPRGGN